METQDETEDCTHDDAENGICIDCGTEVQWVNFRGSYED